MSTKDCRFCGKTFGLKRSNGPKELAGRIYCSRECSAKAQAKAWAPPVKTCRQCQGEYAKPASGGASLWAQRKFCSNLCSNEFRKNETQGRLIEDVSWIVDHDNPHSVAQRVGYGKVEDLINKLGRIGHPELAEKLVRGVERYRVEVPA